MLTACIQHIYGTFDYAMLSRNHVPVQASMDPLYNPFLRIIRSCLRAQQTGIDMQCILRRLACLSRRHEQLASLRIHSSQL